MKLSKLVKKIIAISMACLISGIGFPVSLVFALPQDGNIVGGQGNIHQHTPQDLHIHQDTSNLIVNWQGFNIGASESVQFFQPGIDSVALNRVVGTDPSRIAGRLSANGQVFITNPSGVIFLPGSQVDVHGLLATTLDITDQDFLNRTYRFTQNPNRNLASILNEGTINASYVGLLAPSVVNRGTIVASLGSVALASGKAATLDFIGDDLINFAITEEVEGTGTDADGNVLDYNISNEGLIRADGGVVTLSVRRAGEIVKAVINQEGLIEARTVFNKEGRIFLSGGDNGIVSVTGTLDASGKGAGEKGGTIHVTGENVGLFESAKLDASGDAGGGEILVGGDREGEGELQNARATFIGEDVSINADAITNGDGGKLIVFAEDTARIYGNLSARGGSVSGNGGFIETSGKQYFEIFKTPEIGAPNGLGGEWLIDPFDITITFASVLDGINGVNPFLSSANSSTLPISLIIAALAQGDVTITTGAGGTTQGGDITWEQNAPIFVLVNNALSLSAIGSIILNADITTQGAMFFTAGQSISVNNTNLTGQSPSVFTAPSITLDNANLNFNNNTIIVVTDNLNSPNDFAFSSVNSGTSVTALLPFTSANGLAIGTGPGILSSNVDLSTFLTASSLQLGIGTTGPITVNDALINSLPVAIFSGDSVTFTGIPSTFDTLFVFSNGDINVNTDINVNNGGFTAVADFDQSGAGDFNFGAGNTITVAQNAAITAVNILANGAFNVGGTLTLNGVLAQPPPPPPPPVIPPVNPPLITIEELEELDQAEDSFPAQLLANAKAPGC